MKNINIINQRIALDKVVFQRKINSKSNELKINTIDTFENLYVNGDSIKFSYQRKVSLEPDSLFEVVVSFLYEANIDKDSYKQMMEENMKLENKHFISIVNNTTMPQNASMIISNLTSINGGNPLITPPMFVVK